MNSISRSSCASFSWDRILMRRSEPGLMPALESAAGVGRISGLKYAWSSGISAARRQLPSGRAKI